MTPRLLQRDPSWPVPAGRAPTLLHPECPIEQAVWSPDTAVQAALLQEIWRRENFVDVAVLLVADPKRLRVLARCEAALRRPVLALKARHGPSLIVEAPMVRYAHGAPVLEPWMTVIASGPVAYRGRVQGELGGRSATITRLDSRADSFVLEAEAPLARILGWGDWLETDANGVEASMWLSGYRPIGDDGPRAA